MQHIYLYDFCGACLMISNQESIEICLGSNEGEVGVDRIIWLQVTKAQLILAKAKKKKKGYYWK